MTLHPLPSPPLVADPPTVRDVMTTSLITVGVSDTLLAAWELMTRGGFRHLPVVSGDGRCLGIVDERMVREDWLAGERGLRRRTVGDVMPRRVHCVVADDSLGRVTSIMEAENVAAIPVVDTRMHLVGLVTERDVMRWLVRKLLAK